jgi:apyrase
MMMSLRVVSRCQPQLPRSFLPALILHDPWPCRAQDQCAFNGAWGGGAKPTAFYVSSYFWDRATDAGIIGDKAAITWTLKPTDFSAAAEKACSASVSSISVLFPGVRLTRNPSCCVKSLINAT